MRFRSGLLLVLALIGSLLLGQHVGSPGQAQASSAQASSARADQNDNEINRVVVISLDGLTPTALDRLGTAGTPVLHRLIRQGASTMNARTSVEQTITLPNHTGMVTGRPISRVLGGHGVTWNDDRKTPATVQAAAGGPVASVFTAVTAAGETTGLFATKTKFSLWNRSWPKSFTDTVINLDNAKLAAAARQDLINSPNTFTFIHLSAADVAGHAKGWMSPAYLDAVRRLDGYVGRIIGGIRTGGIADETAVIVTADHGGTGRNHSDARLYVNYRIPFILVGPGVPAGTDLYALNDNYANPKRTQPSYDAARQPIRNSMVANLATDLLDIAAVPGSRLDARQDLVVTQ